MSSAQTESLSISFNGDRSEVYAEFTPSGVPVFFTPELVLGELDRAGAYAFKLDYGSIDAFVNQANRGNAVRLKVGRRIDATVQVDVSGDEMNAYITVQSPHGGAPLTRPQVMSALKDKGVVKGINEAVIDNLLDQGWYDERMLVAEGQGAENGEDTEVEYLFDTVEPGNAPKEMEDGRVDWRELDKLVNVHAGEPLFRVRPATPGVTGFTVTGKVLEARAGKERPVPMGKGVKPSPDDPTLYVAEIPGTPRLSNRKVSVLNVHEVPDDVDFSTGNIDFVGDITIKGNVKEGFVVKAEGNVTVAGVVEGCEIIAGGDIVLQKGMNGQRKGKLKAGGNIMAKFLEQAEVEAGQDVLVNDAILHCDVTAGRAVKVQGQKRAMIAGGTVVATDEIIVKSLGSVASTKTVVEVGGNPKIRQELKEIQDQMEENKKKLERAEKSVKMLKEAQKKEGHLSKDKRDMLLNFTRQQFQLMGDIRRLSMRREELEEVLSAAVKGRITVTDTTFPGVTLIIKQAILKVTVELKGMAFIEKDGQVSYMPYR